VKKNILVATLLILTAHCFSQALNWAWSRSASGTSYDEGVSIATDLLGNVYVVGYYDSPTLTFGTTILTNSGTGNVFLVKYDTNGNVIWARSSGGNNIDACYGVCTDNFGNVYTVGSFHSPTFFLGTTSLTKTGFQNMFLAKYDSNGNVIWAKTNGGTPNVFGNAVSADSQGNIYITGVYNISDVTFDSYTLAHNGTDDIYIVKYDSLGNVVWARNAAGTASDQSISVANDPTGNVYITGYFLSPSILFDTISLTSNGYFIAKYDSNGNALWVKTESGASGRRVISDVSSNIYTTGSFASSVNFGDTTLTSSGGSDIFLTKYNPNGSVIWAESAGSAGTDVGYNIATSLNGDYVYLTGQIDISYTSFFNSLSATPPANSYDPMFIAKYDSTGNVLSATALQSGGDDWNDVAIDAIGNVFVGGDFYSVNPFIIGSDSLPLTGIEDVFIAKISASTTENILTNDNSRSSLTIGPNPFSTEITITFVEEQKHTIVRITDLVGKEIKTLNFTGRQLTIEKGSIQAGVYFVQTTDEKKHIASRKIIVQ
jgi:hypothetical protein